MAKRRVGAAVVVDPEAPTLGIITERDILLSIGDGQDPDTEMVADHLTSELVFAAPDWSLEQGAAAMVRGGFRHLIVIDEGEATGVCPCATSCGAGPTTGRAARCESPAVGAGRVHSRSRSRWRIPPRKRSRAGAWAPYQPKTSPAPLPPPGKPLTAPASRRRRPPQRQQSHPSPGRGRPAPAGPAPAPGPPASARSRSRRRRRRWP